MDGRSLKPVMDGKVKSIYPYIFGYFRNFQRMIRTEEWKLIHYPHLNRYQLFNIRSDPDELKDLSSDRQFAKIKSDLRQKLETWQRQQNDPVLKSD